MQCSHLTDDQLWLAIAENTNAMSTTARAIDELEREYQVYAAELCHRYSLFLHSEAFANAGSNR